MLSLRSLLKRPVLLAICSIYLYCCSCNNEDTNAARAIYIVDVTRDTFAIEITNIDYDTVKYVFQAVDDKGKGQYINGLKPIITFNITNTYKVPKMVPVPSYYYVSTDHYANTQQQGTNYDMRCKCYVAYAATEPALIGREESIYKRHDTMIGEQYALKFAAGETKKFRMTFYNGPFPETEEVFLFAGFTFKNRSDKDISAWGRNADLGFMIDVHKRKVTKQVILK